MSRPFADSISACTRFLDPLNAASEEPIEHGSVIIRSFRYKKKLIKSGCSLIVAERDVAYRGLMLHQAHVLSWALLSNRISSSGAILQLNRQGREH